MLEVKDLKKNFGKTEVIKGISFDVQKGEVVAIIGPSGCGKSTLLRCLNMLEKPTSGKIILDNEDITGKKVDLTKIREKMGMVFQQFNLFPHLTVLENITVAPLNLKLLTKEEATKKALELLKSIGLEDKKDNYPNELSGGQKQRVAIARALATQPKYLLCDEATSALDPNTTNSILDLLKEINEKLGVTIIVITHEMRVVEKICTHVAVLNEGEIVEQGSVQEVFLSPKTKVAQEMIYPKQKFDNRTYQGKVFRLVFGGQASSEPVVANLVLKCHIPVNILGAGTEDIGGKAYGQMLLEFPQDEAVIALAKEYLDSIGVHYEEEDVDGI